ncbi:hypothetical protein DI005_22880 [Prauserella sp. PE36]|nr:hypothetical protein DI005_22880 [Prauserella sp. PE36]
MWRGGMCGMVCTGLPSWPGSCAVPPSMARHDGPEAPMTCDDEAADDAALIAAVRDGRVDAYAELVERHVGAALGVASLLEAGALDREDFVADAFARVFSAIRQGGGPDERFRAYLLATLRNVVATARRRGRRVELHADVPEVMLAAGADERAEDRRAAELARTAFASLPARWRAVLWYSEVEGRKAATVGKMLGIKPNAAAALAVRAREGLRQAFLQAHVPYAVDSDCERFRADLGTWVRGKLRGGRSRVLTRHLDNCPACRDVATALKEVNNALPGVFVPVLCGAAPAVASPVSPSVSVAPSAVASHSSVVAAVASGGGKIAVGITLGVTAVVAPQTTALPYQFEGATAAERSVASRAGDDPARRTACCAYRVRHPDPPADTPSPPGAADPLLSVPGAGPGPDEVPRSLPEGVPASAVRGAPSIVEKAPPADDPLAPVAAPPALSLHVGAADPAER